MQDHGNVDKWLQNGILNKDDLKIENIPFKETNNYVRKIIRDYKIYSEKRDRVLNFIKKDPVPFYEI